MGYRLALSLILLALNAFFSAAEVALVCARKSHLQRFAEKGNAGAQAALRLLANAERLRSVSQAGITLASLGLGWAGGETLFELLYPSARSYFAPEAEPFLRFAAFAGAFLVLSFAHMIAGEVAPKNLALDKADRVAILLSPAMLIFYRLFTPFVAAVERASALLARLAGLRNLPRTGGHSAEELRFIVRSSKQEGHLEPFEEEAIQRILDLDNVYAREIMVPRNQIVSISLDAPLEQVLRTMVEHQYSRLPVYEDNPERIIGYVHYKDLIRIWDERRLANERRRPTRPLRLRRVLRKLFVVPETKPLDQLISEFRQRRTHLAIVVDEFGTVVGLVTLENALEQIFGEIEDEHDERRLPPLLEAPVLEVDGATTIRALEAQYGISLPVEAGFETLAGFLLCQLRSIPKNGDSILYGERRFTVLEMNRNRIVRVRVERMAKPAAEGEASPAGAGGGH